MKLVDILARHLKAWPESDAFAWQDSSREIRFNVTICHDFYVDEVSEDHVRAVSQSNPKSGVTRAEWQAAVDALNAPKVVEWDELGFPPAGVTCEFTTNDGYNWWGCKILYADEVSILTGELEGKADRRLLRKCDADVKFRPVLTAEQVAAEERENAAETLYMAVMDHKTRYWPSLQEHRKEHYRGLVDAGWQKVAK